MSELLQLDPAKIKTVDGFNPRHEFEDQAQKELNESVKSLGVIMPVLVAPDGDGYRLVAGERRLRAALAAKLPAIPALVKEETGIIESLAENLVRADLNPVEEALGYQRALDERKLTVKGLSKALGVSEQRITQRLKIVPLPEALHAQIAAARIPLAWIETLALLNGHSPALAEIVGLYAVEAGRLDYRVIGDAVDRYNEVNAASGVSADAGMKWCAACDGDGIVYDDDDEMPCDVCGGSGQLAAVESGEKAEKGTPFVAFTIDYHRVPWSALRATEAEVEELGKLLADVEPRHGFDERKAALDGPRIADNIVREGVSAGYCLRLGESDNSYRSTVVCIDRDWALDAIRRSFEQLAKKAVQEAKARKKADAEALRRINIKRKEKGLEPFKTLQEAGYEKHGVKEGPSQAEIRAGQERAVKHNQQVAAQLRKKPPAVTLEAAKAIAYQVGRACGVDLGALALRFMEDEHTTVHRNKTGGITKVTNAYASPTACVPLFRKAIEACKTPEDVWQTLTTMLTASVLMDNTALAQSQRFGEIQGVTRGYGGDAAKLAAAFAKVAAKSVPAACKEWWQAKTAERTADAAEAVDWDGEEDGEE